MKKITFMLIALITFSVSAQKKKNGTVYIDHPAIDMIESFQSAWVSGDIQKAGSYLHENFKIFNATSENKEQKGSTKAQMINNLNQVQTLRARRLLYSALQSQSTRQRRREKSRRNYQSYQLTTIEDQEETIEITLAIENMIENPV